MQGPDHLGRYAAAHPDELVVGGAEDRLRVTRGGPDRVVTREADVDDRPDRLGMTDGRDPTDDESCCRPDEVGIRRLDTAIWSMAATLTVLTRWAPEARTSSGVTSPPGAVRAVKTSELAI